MKPTNRKAAVGQPPGDVRKVAGGMDKVRQVMIQATGASNWPESALTRPELMAEVTAEIWPNFSRVLSRDLGQLDGLEA